MGLQTEAPSSVSPMEPGSMRHLEVTCFVVVFSLTIALVLTGNGFVMYLITRSKEMRTKSTNVFLLSLVSARMAVGVFVVPSGIALFYSEAYLGTVFCKLCHFAAMTSSAASVFSIIVIALDKRRSTCSKAPPLSGRQRVIVVLVTWFLSLCYAIRALVTFDLVTRFDSYGNTILSCVLHASYSHMSVVFSLLDTAVLYITPGIAIVVCYVAVVKSLTAAENPEKMKPNSDNRKTAIMVVVLVVLFILCNLPSEVFKVVEFAGVEVPYGYTIETCFQILSFSNSWFNVIVFLTFRRDLQNEAMQLYVVKWCRKRF